MKGARWRYLAMFGPPAFVALCYGFWLRPLQTTQLAGLQAQWDGMARELESLAPSPASASVAPDGPTTDPTQRRHELLRRWSTVAARPEVVRGITHALAAGGITVVRSSAEGVEASGAVVTAASRDLAATMQRAGGVAPELWRIEMLGSWSSLLESLERLQALDWFVLPQCVRVAPRPLTDNFEVTLWLWI